MKAFVPSTAFSPASCLSIISREDKSTRDAELRRTDASVLVGALTMVLSGLLHKRGRPVLPTSGGLINEREGKRKAPAPACLYHAPITPVTL